MSAPTAAEIIARALDILRAGFVPEPARCEDGGSWCERCALGMAKSQLDEERQTGASTLHTIAELARREIIPLPGDGVLLRAVGLVKIPPGSPAATSQEEAVRNLRAGLRRALAADRDSLISGDPDAPEPEGLMVHPPLQSLPPAPPRVRLLEITYSQSAERYFAELRELNPVPADGGLVVRIWAATVEECQAAERAVLAMLARDGWRWRVAGDDTIHGLVAVEGEDPEELRRRFFGEGW